MIKMKVTKNKTISILVLVILVQLVILLPPCQATPQISDFIINYKTNGYPMEVHMTFNVKEYSIWENFNISPIFEPSCKNCSTSDTKFVSKSYMIFNVKEYSNWENFNISPIFEPSCKNCSTSDTKFVSKSYMYTEYIMNIKADGKYIYLINDEVDYLAEAQFNFTSKKDENTADDNIDNKRNILKCWATVEQNKFRPNILLINCVDSNNENNILKFVIDIGCSPIFMGIGWVIVIIETCCLIYFVLKTIQAPNLINNPGMTFNREETTNNQDKIDSQYNGTNQNGTTDISTAIELGDLQNLDNTQLKN